MKYEEKIEFKSFLNQHQDFQKLDHKYILFYLNPLNFKTEVYASKILAFYYKHILQITFAWYNYFKLLFISCFSQV